MTLPAMYCRQEGREVVNSQRCSCCLSKEDNNVKLQKSNFVCQAWNHMKIICAEFSTRIHSFIMSTACPCRNKNETNNLKEKEKKHSGFIDKLEKNQWKPHIKLPEASLGTGLRHPVIFHHKMLKMGHCLWHVLSSLATLHLTRSKTKKEKKAFKSPNKKHMASHSITAIFSPASLTRTTCSLLH